jgi:toxin FitB
MIVLDTDVLSELMRPAPDARVVSWVNHGPVTDFFATTVTQAEIFAGLAAMPTGKRREDLAAGAAKLFDRLFVDRILPFDSRAAMQYASISASRRRAGRPITVLDCQIAATARAEGAVVATRNIRDFEGCGVDIVNPWSAGVSG